MTKLLFKKVTEEKELIEVYKLRYKVYCEEWGFEKQADHSTGLEVDGFDEHSVHFIAMDSEDQIIGTIRVIKNSPKGFPIERNCRLNMDISAPNKDKTGEISRLAVSKKYRRRAEDRFIFEGFKEYHPDLPPIHDERRRKQEIVLGLYKCLYSESKRIGLSHWYAVMARGLYVLLKRLGVVFQPIGPETDYHGLRTPYIGSIEEIEREVLLKNPDLFREFTEVIL